MAHNPTATQRLRDMIDEMAAGLYSPDDLHNELSNLEVTLGQAITSPSVNGTLELL